MDTAPAPERLPAATPPPVCWRADYTSEGEATVWACGYRASASAFEALQRMQPAANEVKFQKGRYLVVVQWKGASQANMTILITALQKAIEGD